MESEPCRLHEVSRDNRNQEQRGGDEEGSFQVPISEEAKEARGKGEGAT